MKLLTGTRLLRILLLVIIAQPSFSQSLINANGTTVRNNAFIVEYSIGEIAITTLSSLGDLNYSTQGLLQPSLKIIAPECEIINDILVAFPNPTANLVRIVGRFNWISEYVIYAADGKLVAKEAFSNNYIDMTRFPAGLYLVRLLPGCNGQFKTLKIIKQNK